MDCMSALVVLVPEAEPLVGPYRIKYDTSAADGMPAHITINVPFVPAAQNESGAIRELRDLFSQFRSFRYALASVGQFPGITYLAPEPERPFMELIEGVFNRFPDSPPYGGEYGTVVPHLTVAAPRDKWGIEEIHEQFVRSASKVIPIRATVDEVWLVDNRDGKWTMREAFTLGGNPV